MPGSDEDISSDIDEPFLDSGSKFIPSSNCSEGSDLSVTEGTFSEPVIQGPKRKKNEGQWKRNVRKRKRAAGGDFFSTKELEKALANRKKTEAYGKVQWLRIQWLRYDNEKPGIVQYKYSNNEDVLFNEVNVKNRGKQTFQEMAKLLPLFKGPKPIQENKYQDLLSLLDYIPPVHHEFYRQLVHNARVEEDLDDFEDHGVEEDE